MGLVGEAKVTPERCFNVYGDVSYLNVRMSNFFKGTIKENILFFHEYNPIRYQRVIHAIGLHMDYFENFDQTILLENAKNIPIT